jgi:hypothetical protein
MPLEPNSTSKAWLSHRSEIQKTHLCKKQALEPTPAPFLIEIKLTEFEKELKSKHAERLPKYKKINASNLTPIQANTLKLLKSNKDFKI